MAPGGSLAASAAISPLLQQATKSRNSGASQRNASELQQGEDTFKHKLHDLGRQIHHLVALFHELEDQCDFDRTSPKIEHHSTNHSPSQSPNQEGGNGKTSSVWAQNLEKLTPFTEDWWVQIPTISGATKGHELWSETRKLGNEDQSREALLDAIRDNSVENLSELLQMGADPNAAWTNVSIGGKTFVSITPLVASVLQDDIDSMCALLEYKASVESTYSFAAGAQQQTWTGSVAHACVASGKFSMLRHLDEFNADLHKLSSNGANLLWQAAYFGHASILEFLLDRGVSVECSAVSQDNSELTYSPLHAAARHGHEMAVSLLLEARADVLHDDGHGCQPLEDAARAGHAGIVKELIINNGDLWAKSKFSCMTASGSFSSEKRMNCLENILGSQNAVLISMVVQGLGQAPKLLDSLTKDDFLRILNAPGMAPIHAMEAIFKPYQLSYWEAHGGHMSRKQPRTAYVDIEDSFNLMEGPHHRSFRKMFEHKQVIEPETLDFMTELLPQEGAHSQKFVPISSFMCHVPFVHKDLRVLLALADCPNASIFSTVGCRAIICWKWRNERTLARFRMVVAGIEVANFMAMNFITDENAPSWVPVGPVSLQVTNIVSLVVWIVAMYMELSQMLGYMCAGLTKRYFTRARHWFDLLVVVMTGAVSLSLLFADATHDSRFCTALGVLVFCKWGRFLVYLRQIKAIGIQILPITQTMWDIVPFLLVFSLYFLATVNMFYALNTGYSFPECFMLIYSLVVLGDGDPSTLENSDAELAVDLLTGAVLQTAPQPTDNFVVVRIMMVFASFVIGVSLMNLFLAMLCLSYSQAHEQAHLSFMRSLANIVLDNHAVRLGTARVGCCCQRKHTEMLAYGSCGSDFDVTESTSFKGFKIKTNADSLPDTAPSSRKAFLWFAKQAD